MFKTVVLYMPEEFPGVGGIQTLIAYLAAELVSARHPDVRVIIYCGRGSFLQEFLKPIAGERLDIRLWEDAHYELPVQSLLVVWNGYKSVAKFKHANPKVFVWCVAPGQAFTHFDLLSKRLPYSRSLLHKARKNCIRFLLKSHGIVSMDAWNNAAVGNYLNESVHVPFLPIGLPVVCNEWVNRRGVSKSRRLRVSWIGRGDVHWKVIPICSLLKHAKYGDGGVDVTIYTDTANLYEQVMSEVGINRDLVRVSYQLNVAGEELRAQLAESMDINFGMGLALLEGASVGVPSVYLRPIGGKKEMVPWQWVYERQDYDFGVSDLQVADAKPFDMDFFASHRESLDDASQKSFGYTEKHHDIINIAEKVVTCATMVDAEAYLRSQGVIMSMSVKCAGLVGSLRK